MFSSFSFCCYYGGRKLSQSWIFILTSALYMPVVSHDTETNFSLFFYLVTRGLHLSSFNDSEPPLALKSYDVRYSRAVVGVSCCGIPVPKRKKTNKKTTSGAIVGRSCSGNKTKKKGKIERNACSSWVGKETSHLLYTR